MVAGQTLVALLRGINVGGSGRVTMADLRAVVREAGHPHATTYLQTGNVILPDVVDRPVDVAAALERAIARGLGLDTRVIVRTADELTAVVEADPLGAPGRDPARRLVTFLVEAPPPGALDALDPAALAPEEFRLEGRELYLWCPGGAGRSPLARLPWDRLLQTPGTARNWNTVTRLQALATA